MFSPFKLLSIEDTGILYFLLTIEYPFPMDKYYNDIISFILSAKQREQL